MSRQQRGSEALSLGLVVAVAEKQEERVVASEWGEAALGTVIMEGNLVRFSCLFLAEMLKFCLD